MNYFDMFYSMSGFLNLRMTEIWNRVIFCWGIDLYIVGCLATSLVSTY